MGARFDQNIMFSETATEETISKASQASKSSSTTFSAKVEAEGWGASASVGTTQGNKSGTDSSKSNSKSSNKSNSVSTGSTKVYGQINMNNKCGKLTGGQDILFPVEYDTEPIWKAFDPTKYEAQIALFKTFLNDLRANLLSCAETKCNKAGVCKVKKLFMDNNKYEKGFMDKMYDESCICNSNRTGSTCK